MLAHEQRIEVCDTQARTVVWVQVRSLGRNVRKKKEDQSLDKKNCVEIYVRSCDTCDCITKCLAD